MSKDTAENTAPNTADSGALSPELVPENCIAFNIGRAYRAVLRRYEQAFKAADITTMQYGLLVHTAILEPASGIEISQSSGHDPSTLSRTLAYMEEAGYIRGVKPVAGDRRKRVYSLTSAGRSKLNEALPLWEQVQKEILLEIGEEQWVEGLKSLKKIQQIN
ncbi:MarR family winged helix-turn-helix transcriptional regulator [Salinispira pacifica]|uniref:Transcriptional regulator, MarR family n=1 Tax=Salinispira pacifica TaxID=1307761 RepID=V5WFF2_9SPIO|nr:MarR family winged helix-turn-helix transcriptional regulator [Salinispira pacifica]AHC13911.1 Transcriptional regulator, MarR family [Salinispira pacifica]